MIGHVVSKEYTGVGLDASEQTLKDGLEIVLRDNEKMAGLDSVMLLFISIRQ